MIKMRSTRKGARRQGSVGSNHSEGSMEGEGGEKGDRHESASLDKVTLLRLGLSFKAWFEF